VSTTTTKAPTAAEIEAKAKLDELMRQYAALTGSDVNRSGDWPHFIVNIGQDAFDVRALVDGVLITPLDDSRLSRAYARDAMSLLNFWRRMESGATIKGKILRTSDGAPTLASIILQAIEDYQVQQAMCAVNPSNSRFGR
jgi:hypothetical protein